MSGVRTGNRKLMREVNTNLVLNLIRRADRISSADITKRTRLSAGTVASVVRELIGGKFIEKVGPGESTVGRKPTLLRFNPEARWVIGAGFFADETQLAIVDLNGNIKKQTTFLTHPDRGPEAVFANFASETNRLLADSRIARRRVLGVGVGFEGLADRATGGLSLSVRFGWRNVPVREHIERELGIRTLVDSDGCAMALGEYRFGVGRGAGDMVILDVDAGIGAVAIANGSICRGAHSMAGEIGHTLMVPDGPICRCGKRGCLETVASGSAVVADVRRERAQGRKSSISEMVDSHSTREAVRAIFHAAKERDPYALEVIHQAGHYLGLATAAVINFADPELIILTGCVTDESDGMILDAIRRVAGEQVIDSEVRTIRIEEGMLGKDAVLVGAATLVYEEVFKPPLS